MLNAFCPAIPAGGSTVVIGSVSPKPNPTVKTTQPKQARVDDNFARFARGIKFARKGLPYIGQDDFSQRNKFIPEKVADLWTVSWNRQRPLVPPGDYEWLPQKMLAERNRIAKLIDRVWSLCKKPMTWEIKTRPPGK
ncbi:MAG: hypothetical protein ABSE63_04695 [Thermoguttaceae bacterium]|jgi:hypothetical protein